RGFQSEARPATNPEAGGLTAHETTAAGPVPIVIKGQGRRWQKDQKGGIDSPDGLLPLLPPRSRAVSRAERAVPEVFGSRAAEAHGVALPEQPPLACPGRGCSRPRRPTSECRSVGVPIVGTKLRQRDKGHGSCSWMRAQAGRIVPSG